MTIEFQNLEGDCVGHGLRRAARQATRRYDAALRPVALSLGQFSILAAVGAAGPVPLGALASHLGMDRTTLSRDVKPLQRRGLIATSDESSDRRQRPLVLTAPGREILQEAMPLWAAAQSESARRLGATPWPELRNLLTTL